MARKQRLLALLASPAAERAGVLCVLVHIDEAHSNAWPVWGRPSLDPQKDLGERVQRAARFRDEHVPPEAALAASVAVMADTWDNQFAETFRAWPDQFFHVVRKAPAGGADGGEIEESAYVAAKSEYGKYADALLDVDCTEILEDVLAPFSRASVSG